MKKVSFILLMFCLSIVYPSHGFAVETGKQKVKPTTFGFLENKGQIADQNGIINTDVLFLAEVPYGSIAVRKDGFSYSFIKATTDQDDNTSPGCSIYEHPVPDAGEGMDEPPAFEIYRVDMKLRDANPEPAAECSEMAADYNNYYLAHCPDGITGVRKFGTVRLKEVYDGIDLVIYVNHQGLVQYDFILKPGADPRRINFAFHGAKDISVSDDGNLIINTPFGNIEQQAPIAYQLDPEDQYLNSSDYYGSAEEVEKPSSRFVINSDRSVTFFVDGYDPSRTLVIDPPTRLWGTYYGGSAYWGDYGRAVATDGSGNVYMVGETASTNAIATAGAHQTVNSLGTRDAFLVKFNNNGERQWGTYYGGTGAELGLSVAADSDGKVYIAGNTASATSISTPGAHQVAYGGSYDGFLVKFNADGVRQWGTYYGGSSIDYGTNIAIDPLDNIYLVGETGSASGIATSGSHQSVIPGPHYQSYLAKFNAAGVRQWGTYYGHSSGMSQGRFVHADLSGNIYMGGTTRATSGIATSGTHQTVYGGGPSGSGLGDAFLVSFNANGVRQWGTYYGGSNQEDGLSATTDGSGNVYLTGYTTSSNAIATTNAHQTAYGGSTDAFLVKFSDTGVRQWGTYFGGSSSEYSWDVNADGSDNVFITGETASVTGISTAGSHQPLYGGGYKEAYLAQFSHTGEQLWGSYYGGNGEDYGKGITIHPPNNLYLVGNTGSNESISTPGAHQPNRGGYDDAFIVKFELDNIPTIPEQLLLNNQTFSSGNHNCMGAVQFIEVGNTTIQNGAYLGLTAGSYISLLPGTIVQSGARLLAWIDTDSSYCDAVFPANVISSLTIGDSQDRCFPATETIITSDFVVQPGGAATLVAGQSVKLLTGTHAQSGGYLRAWIDPAGNYCNQPVPAIPLANETIIIGEHLPSGLSTDDGFRIYPNPADGPFLIEFINSFSGAEIEIYNMMGVMVLRKETNASPTLRFDLSQNPPGLFIIRIREGERIYTKKLVKR